MNFSYTIGKLNRFKIDTICESICANTGHTVFYDYFLYLIFAFSPSTTLWHLSFSADPKGSILIKRPRNSRICITVYNFSFLTKDTSAFFATSTVINPRTVVATKIVLYSICILCTSSNSAIINIGAKYAAKTTTRIDGFMRF